MATEAWDSGWAAAGPAVDDLAVLPLRTALDRATRAARVAAADLEEEDSERAEEQAEAAAKDVLTRSILDPAGWPQGEHPWDAALEAARTAEGAAAWARVQHLARAAVDEGPWRSEEHTSELQSLMRISYAVFCLQK